MNKRIRAPLAIHFRTSSPLETKVFIEANRLRILLIHVGGQALLYAPRMFDQHPPNTRSMLRWIDEERLHMSMVEKHETYREIAVVDGHPKWSLWQEGKNLCLDIMPIGGRQK